MSLAKINREDSNPKAEKAVNQAKKVKETRAVKNSRYLKDGHICGIFVVGNDKGLHTRPSTELVKCAAGFKAQIRLVYQKNQVNAKSLLGILMLAAAKGSKISVEAEGEDAEEAVESILKLAKNNFNMRY